MNRAWLRAPTLALLVACADWLFFGEVIGLSLAFFLAMLAAGILLCGSIKVPRREVAIAIVIAIVGLLPLIERVSLLASLLAVLTLAHLALTVSATTAVDIVQRASRSFGLIFAGPLLCLGGSVRWIASRGRASAARRVGNAAILWTMPAAFGAVFVFLFAAANPVIDDWLAEIHLDRLLAALDIGRMFFWLVMAVIISPFVFHRYRLALPPIVTANLAPEMAPWPEWVSGDGAVLRSLTVFNLIFAVETLLDLHYLWSGAALPQGLAFADYAHRGAYPLMATALLAGAFVIIAMKPGSAREHTPVVRALVFAWVAQNVLLVASSMLRLKLYVETYSLTYWRCAAFIWMFLVALGLIWIVVRIILKQSNRWLVSANLLTLGATLYFCGFVNFASIVAIYNVAHSREMTGTGQSLDLDYLTSLGPEAIPAIDRYIARADVISGALLLYRQRLAEDNRAAMMDWRGWSLCGWRLAYYLRHHV
jgi:hypothetical protein